MKRFYCTVCKKVKRVRRLPILTGQFVVDLDGETILNKKVDERQGKCRYHDSLRYSSEVRDRLHVVKTRPVAVKVGRR